MKNKKLTPFIFVVSMFIGILAYNMYVPKLPTYTAVNEKEMERVIGFFVGAFFMVSSYFALINLRDFLIEKKD